MEMVCILREFHSRGFVHRDVKPSNFLTRPNSPTPLCLIDFGLSKRFINSVTGEYVEAGSSCFVGTCRYASVNSHRRLELGPRDDMVSWLFSIVELIRGELPWHSIAERDSVLGVKQAMSAEELCRDVPHELVSIYESLLALQCRDMPDYDMILMQLTQALRSAGGAATEKYDWELLDEQTMSAISVRPMQRGSTEQGNPYIIRETPLLREAPSNFDEEIGRYERRCPCGNRCGVS
jgi:serine/threonine protein kinase